MSPSMWLSGARADLTLPGNSLLTDMWVAATPNQQWANRFFNRLFFPSQMLQGNIKKDRPPKEKFVNDIISFENVCYVIYKLCSALSYTPRSKQLPNHCLTDIDIMHPYLPYICQLDGLKQKHLKHIKGEVLHYHGIIHMFLWGDIMV